MTLVTNTLIEGCIASVEYLGPNARTPFRYHWRVETQSTYRGIKADGWALTQQEAEDALYRVAAVFTSIGSAPETAPEADEMASSTSEEASS